MIAYRGPCDQLFGHVFGVFGEAGIRNAGIRGHRDSAGKSRANSSGEAYGILLNRWSASPSAVMLSQRPKARRWFAVVDACSYL
jgi:hypothetical protein